MQTSCIVLLRPGLFIDLRGTRWILPRRSPHPSRASGESRSGDTESIPTASPRLPLPPSFQEPRSQQQKSLRPDDNDARAQVKVRLRQLISKVNAAALPGPADLASLGQAVQELIRLNPTPCSATSDLINGRWVLLYTASIATLRQAAATEASASNPRQGVAGNSSNNRSNSFGGSDGYSRALEAALSPLQLANEVAYRFFYTYVPVLAGAAVGSRGGSASGPVKPRGNFQVFNTQQGTVENQARFEIGGRLCCINVNGAATVVEGPPGQPRQRLRATFTSFVVLLDGQRRLSLPLSFLNPQVGYVDTPYLDEEIRISIGDKGSIFIAARENSS
ncbi:hypothetical protein VaNZ11_014087 [Volvox africanus]|uniref:Plastid lipid-associated protein/fibrillin conserved domain-containing protein n=1 Tax=Volvox africanus TaxID=51714 RepID=A0ABQ5SJ64_9CHLO|nr:hypothetical protein VaNZ11_014087 [Volvox africanus]